MDNKDYSELTLLLKGAQQALLSGELNDWQHATTSTFHLMAQFILDLNERLLNVAGPYPSANQSMHKAATGVKHDEEKIPLDLLDPLALEGLAKVLQFGAKKYARENWRGGISYSRVFAALLRHTFAILRGEYIDPESGLPHIDHVGCCWMFASYFMKKRPDLDDLYKEPK